MKYSQSLKNNCCVKKLLLTIYDRSASPQIQSIDIRIPTKLFMAQKERTRI